MIKVFLLSLLLYSQFANSGHHGNKIKPTKTPVELIHGDTVKVTKMSFFNGKKVNIKLNFNKNDLVNGLYYLKKGESVPKHYNDGDKAY